MLLCYHRSKTMLKVHFSMYPHCFMLAFFFVVAFVYLEEMSKSVRHLKCPAGRTVGDLIDCTPREVMAKVMLEDRHFKTWFHGRTVLLGDGKGVLSYSCQSEHLRVSIGSHLLNANKTNCTSMVLSFPCSSPIQQHVIRYRSRRSHVVLGFLFLRH